MSAEQFRFAGRGGKMMIERPHADLDQRARFAGDIGFARRVVADENDGKAGHQAVRGRQAARFRRHGGAQVGGDRLAVDDSSCHGVQNTLGNDVKLDHLLNEYDDQEQYDRRNIDAAEIGQHVADRAQRRVGDAIEKIADHRDDVVARVHHVESDEPGEDRHRDHNPDVDGESDIDDFKKSAHGPGSPLRMAETSDLRVREQAEGVANAWRRGGEERRLVEPRGVEPLTSSLRTRRSPN